MSLPRLLRRTSLAVLLLAFGSVGPALAADPQVAANALAMGLSHMTRETPLRIQNGDGTTSVRLDLGGTDVELVLHPFSMRQTGCDVVEEGPGRVQTKASLPPSLTYQGTVRGGATGVAAVSIDGNDIQARILLDDGSDWYVQPVPGGAAGEHAVYRSTDVTEVPGACAVDQAAERLGQVRMAPQTQSSGCVEAEIAIEGDYAYYQWCGGSTNATVADIDAIMNAVTLIYARDAKISYKITKYLIQTADTGKYPSTDPNTKLAQFQSWWNANEGSVTRDTAHLMTGADMNGLIGISMVAVICQPQYAYGISHSPGAIWANRVGLTAHELGHNWAATHCDGQPDCWIMCSHVNGCAADPTRFSPISIAEIETYRNLSGSCLAQGSGTSTPLPPTARDDATVTTPGTAVTVNVLANDFDANCQTISLAGVSSPTPNGGTARTSGDAVVYTPAPGFVGDDTFPYTVQDAGGSQSTANVTVHVQDYLPSVPVSGAVAGIQVRYYYCPILDGNLGSMPSLSNPYKMETVPTLSFPTTDGEVAESGLTDKVAARCTGIITIPQSATYTFYLTCDDGGILTIDGSVVVNNDGIHTMQERSGSVSLSAGTHSVQVDYYDATGPAGLKLEIQGGSLSRMEVPASMWTSPGVRIAYYQLDSSLVPPLPALVPEKTQLISTINYPFSWGTFAGSGRSQNMGAEYEGYLTVPSDNVYFFELMSEDGSKLWIDGQLVVNDDGAHNRVALTGGVPLRAGAHAFRLDYFLREGGCALTLSVSSSSVSKQIVPASWLSHLNTVHVPTDYATIGAAIAAASSNSMVWVAPGTYTGSGNKNLDLGGKNLTLHGGGGADLTVIDCQNSGRAFAFVNHSQPNAVIEGFTISGANTSTAGAAMSFSNSTLLVRDCTIKGNMTPASGGALSITGNSSPTFDDCVIVGNHAGGDGGAIEANGSVHPSFVGCTISGNDAGGAGGGAHAVNGATVSFVRSILWGNAAVGSGSEGWTGDATGTIEFACADVRSYGVGGSGIETYDANTIIADPEFCVPAPPTLSPTTGGGYRVASASPVFNSTGSCGGPIGARGVGCGTATTAVEPVPVVSRTQLEQNVPNPFNPETRIGFALAQGGRTTLRIYSVGGRLVATILDRDLPAGRHEVTWRGTDDANRAVATGVYFYQVRSGGEVLTRSMVLLK
ncbi:MAG: PA14 domain-containing protein [Hyphomicrobiales bacterium]